MLGLCSAGNETRSLVHARHALSAELCPQCRVLILNECTDITHESWMGGSIERRGIRVGQVTGKRVRWGEKKGKCHCSHIESGFKKEKP